MPRFTEASDPYEKLRLRLKAALLIRGVPEGALFEIDDRSGAIYHHDWRDFGEGNHTLGGLLEVLRAVEKFGVTRRPDLE